MFSTFPLRFTEQDSGKLPTNPYPCHCALDQGHSGFQGLLGGKVETCQIFKK